MNKQDADQAVPPHRVVCSFVVCMQQSEGFSGQGPYGPQHEKTCLRGFANNKGAYNPAHPHSLISTFVIRLCHGHKFTDLTQN